MSKVSRPANLLLRLVETPLEFDEAARAIGGGPALERWLASTSMASRDGDVVRLAIDPEEAQAAADSLRRTVAERRQLSLLRLLEAGELEETAARRASGATKRDVDALERAGLPEAADRSLGRLGRNSPIAAHLD